MEREESDKDPDEVEEPRVASNDMKGDEEDDEGSLLLGTLNLVHLVTGLYGSLVRRVYITWLHITVSILFFGRLMVPETFSFKIGFL